jgi:hypothetical protein
MQKFVTHSKYVSRIARRFGWLPGARYTNLRDVRGVDRVGFLDIDWREYNFRRHVAAAGSTRPIYTVARDITDCRQLARTLEEAAALAEFSEHVIVVPKDLRLSRDLNDLIPPQFILGFSVRSTYGGTMIAPRHFRRPVHLLGGRPDVQRRLAAAMPVISFDCNRFTLDAAFGDFFDGHRFRPHPVGGYERCLRDSLRNINRLWKNYRPPSSAPEVRLA